MDDNFLVVAAFDFGTAYSGYGFSLKTDPSQVNTANWIPGSGGGVSMKTPTCILFDPKGNFDSFGYEAEDNYADLAFDNKHHGWSYFNRFKMQLYNKVLSRKLMLKDDQGNSMPAMDVISAAIKYLKRHFLEACLKQQTYVTESDVRWILTVPAIWGDPAKSFMRESAEKAGIDGKNLVLALEPEAASLFCMQLPLNKVECDGVKDIKAFGPGSKYLVLDCGGGTVDITVHEILQNRYLKEIYKANGGDWGGTLVDQEFINFLKNIFGAEIFEKFCKVHTSDMLTLLRDIELKKRQLKPDTSELMKLKLPASLFDTHQQSSEMKTIAEAISQKPCYADNVKFAYGKIQISASVWKAFFSTSIEQIQNHLDHLFKLEALYDVNTILMVGGYSECSILYNAIKTRFSMKRVIVPTEAGLAVLKGAVLYGYDTAKIQTRICKYTYGFGSSLPFDEKIHLPSKRYVNALGQVRCINLFDVHARIGEAYSISEPQVEKSYGIGDPSKSKVTFTFYMSTDPEPFYTNEPSCTKIGKITIDISSTVGLEDRKVVLQIFLGGTEIKVTGQEEKSGKAVEARFDFL